MKHLGRILSVVVPVIAAGASTMLATPAVVDFLEKHPADALYVTVVAGGLRAAWKAYRDRTKLVDEDDTVTPGTVPTNASMGAK